MPIDIDLRLRQIAMGWIDAEAKQEFRLQAPRGLRVEHSLPTGVLPQQFENWRLKAEEKWIRCGAWNRARPLWVGQGTSVMMAPAAQAKVEAAHASLNGMGICTVLPKE